RRIIGLNREPDDHMLRTWSSHGPALRQAMQRAKRRRSTRSGVRLSGHLGSAARMARGPQWAASVEKSFVARMSIFERLPIALAPLDAGGPRQSAQDRLAILLELLRRPYCQRSPRTDLS